MNRIFITFPFFMSAVIAFSILHTYADEGTGIINGKISVDVEKYKRNSVVYIEKAEGDFSPPEEHSKMDLMGLVFVPHVLTVLKGATVDFLNRDYVPHNVMSPDDVADKIDLGTWLKGKVKSYTFNKLGIASMLCKIHSEMESYVVVLQNPYFSKTDKDGNYAIENVPPGKYTLKIWNKKYRAKGQNIEIKSGETLAVDFKLNRENSLKK